MKNFEESDPFKSWKKFSDSSRLLQQYQEIQKRMQPDFGQSEAIARFNELAQSAVWRAIEENSRKLNGSIDGLGRLNGRGSLLSTIEANWNHYGGWEKHILSAQNRLGNSISPNAYDDLIRKHRLFPSHLDHVFETSFASHLSESSKWLTGIGALLKDRPLHERLAFQQDAIEKLNEFARNAGAFLSDAESSGAGKTDNEQLADSDMNQQLVELGSALNGVNDFSDFFEKLLSWLKIHSGSIVTKFVLPVLLSYVVSIVANLHTPIYESWWKQFNGDNLRQEAKEIRSLANRQFPYDLLRGSRFVSVKSLNVHSEPKMKSAIEDTLKFGRVVRILKKKKSWAQVEYHDEETNQTKTGWVLLRFVKPLH